VDWIGFDLNSTVTRLAMTSALAGRVHLLDAAKDFLERHGWTLTLVVLIATWMWPRVRARAERERLTQRGKNESYARARLRALERAEEELRRAQSLRDSAPGDGSRETEEAKRAEKLAALDAKAKRLGLQPPGRGHRLGGDERRNGAPEWSPLMGSGSSSRGYRPARRVPPGGG
jgi:hypothetical protein